MSERSARSNRASVNAWLRERRAADEAAAEAALAAMAASKPDPLRDPPDYVVLRHSHDMPLEYWADRYEGYWYNLDSMPRIIARLEPALAVAEPTGRLEFRDDGAAAEVWEIRLTTPNERREEQV